MNRSARVALLLAICVAGSMPIAAVGAQGPATDAAVRKLAADWIGGWNAHDVNALMALFAGPQAAMINGGAAITTADSLRASFDRQMDQVTSYKLTLDRTKVVVTSPSTAFLQATFSGILAYKDGRTLQWKSNAHFTVLAELRGGTWKIASIHNSAGAGVAVPR